LSFPLGIRYLLTVRLFDRLSSCCYFPGHPGSGAFLTPGSGIRNKFFPDPGSQTHIFEGLVTIFWVKIGPNFFSSAYQNKIIFSFFVKFVATKDGLTTNFFFTPVFCFCFWIRDPRSGIRDKHPGSATLPRPILFDKIQVCRVRINCGSRNQCLFDSWIRDG
jgi:hypothetical protein